MIVNIHERTYQAPAAEVLALVATLSHENDRLWPHESWPRMRFDRGLVVGARGGHGPVHYQVESVDPRREVRFLFTSPSGFDGGHAFSVVAASESLTVLRHEIRMRARGWARLTWPLFFRPLHDALLEEAFDKAGRELGLAPDVPSRRTAWAALLHRLTVRVRRTRAPVGTNAVRVSSR